MMSQGDSLTSHDPHMLFQLSFGYSTHNAPTLFQSIKGPGCGAFSSQLSPQHYPHVVSLGSPSALRALCPPLLPCPSVLDRPCGSLTEKQIILPRHAWLEISPITGIFHEFSADQYWKQSLNLAKLCKNTAEM